MFYRCESSSLSASRSPLALRLAVTSDFLAAANGLAASSGSVVRGTIRVYCLLPPVAAIRTGLRLELSSRPLRACALQ